MLLICIGAVFVYRSVRRQFYMQQQQQNFMMAVTHELKTPISVIKLNLETMQKYSLDAEKQKKLIRTTLKKHRGLIFLPIIFLLLPNWKEAAINSQKKNWIFLIF